MEPEPKANRRTIRIARVKSRGVGRPPRARPGETRRAILDAAEEGFSARGFSGTTTRGVAERARVNVAMLHYHFGSKGGLFRAVWEEAVARSLPVATSGSPSERLAQSLERLWNLGAAQPAFARLALFELLERESGEQGGTRVDDPRIRFLSEILAAQPAPRRALADPTARCIVTLLDASVLASFDPEIRNAPRERERYRAAVVSAALRIAGFR